MATSKEFEMRLAGWASEYAGGRYENLGWPGKSWHYNHIKYHGRAPDGLTGDIVQLGTPADEIEEAVCTLEKQQDGFRPGRVLRAEYWLMNAPEEQKLQALRSQGLPMSRTGFYVYLTQAKIHVAAWIRIPFSPEVEGELASGRKV